MSNVCDKIVANDYCIGCGVCAGVCPVENLEMQDSSGFGYVPADQGVCRDGCDLCLRVCPFASQNDNEDDIASALYETAPGSQHCAEAGFYSGSYAGYVTDAEHRWQSGSGGIASWFLSELLRSGVVDRVVCVVKTGNIGSLFEYRIMDSSEEVLQAGKPAYYPVELSGVLKLIMDTPRKYAVIGLPCFVKALRLAASRNHDLQERLRVCIGLVYGQLCSKGFTELLIRHKGLDAGDITEVCYRAKQEGASARSYGVSFKDANGAEYSFTDMKFFWRLWHMSALRPCSFCDDVFAETADIVFMDAWLPEYILESRGTNLVITRSSEAGEMLLNGRNKGEICLEPLPVDRILDSQRGVIRKKRQGLAYRLYLQEKKAQITKRVQPMRPPFFERLRLIAELYATRQNVQALHAQARSGLGGIEEYSRKMRRHLFIQQFFKVPRKLKECVLSVFQ